MTRRLPIALLLAIPLGLAVAAYGRTLDGEFLLDDVRVVRKNEALGDAAAILRGFGGSLLHGGRPTTELTFALSHAQGGKSPRAFHLGNLLLHLASVVLAFLFTRAVLRRAGSDAVSGVALAVAGLFALHPLQSQAVSYVSQRSEVLASGLYLATLLLLLRADRLGPGLAGALAGVGALALFTLGMGAKAIVATVPVAGVLLLAAVPPAGPRSRPSPWRWRIALLAPVLLVDVLLVGGALRAVEGHADAGFSVPGSSPGSYFLTQWRAVATYVRLLAWPAGQSADWAFPWSRGLGDPGVLASGALLASMLVGAAALWWRCRGRDEPASADGRAAAYGVAWFFLVLAPTSSFLPIADLLVEHRVYLASWGLFLGAVLGGKHLLARLGPKRDLAAVLVVGAAWAVLAVALHQRNAVWEGALVFWRDVVDKAPGKARPRLGLGVAKLKHGDLAGAEAEFVAGIARTPPDATVLRVALLHNLGGTLIRLGRAGEALGPLREAVRIDPTENDPRESLALALWLTGDLAGAGREAQAVLERSPGASVAARVLGQVRMSRDDDAGAVPLLEQAVRALPSDAAVRYDLGAAYANLGRVSEACASWRAVLQLPAAGDSWEAARQGMAILECPP
jgi:tetratricopeptide (TPR) repeat protein